MNTHAARVHDTRARPGESIAASPSRARRAVRTASLGNTLEWYDFVLYEFFAASSPV